ncbi:unnamed protein product [Psylliodes chrysocephalus]|uniref:Ionotropic receptor n=1 Tax=Psylliodes chrysocephalus TaxID=3402493 RepID=A0A9P0D3G4_9CUCU|nr:unnamed protein product [Psylliodes chrysocephala]
MNITEKLKILRLNINSDMNLVILKQSDSINNANVSIYDVYNPAFEHGGELKVDIFGYYNQKQGYIINNLENKYWRRKNMTGVTFKSAVVVPFLYVPLNKYLASDENRQIDSMHRFQANTVNHCKDMYNFSLKIQRTDSWGYIQANGRFDGLVSLLERRLVDFGSSPLLFKLDRMPSTFIYRKPKVTATSYEIFLRPLETEVWIVILITLGAILIILKIIFRNEVKVFRKRNFSVDDTTWSFLVLFTLGAFCQQGASCYPKFLSSRILAFFIFLFSILIYQFYSASIVSYLLLEPPRTIFDLKDLKESSLRVGIEDILIDRNYFVQTTDPDAIELFETKIKGSNNNSGFYSPEEGLELVRQGGFAFHVETSTAYPIIERTFSNQDICELEEVQMYRTQPMFTNLQKNSPFREMMNYCMFKQSEDGNMDRLRRHWDARQPECIQAAKKQEFHVSFKEFSCGPVAVLLGSFLALIFLSLEIFLYHKQRLFTAVKSRIKSNRSVHKLYPFTK